MKKNRKFVDSEIVKTCDELDLSLAAPISSDGVETNATTVWEKTQYID